jgi:hypothetical protein
VLLSFRSLKSFFYFFGCFSLVLLCLLLFILCFSFVFSLVSVALLLLRRNLLLLNLSFPTRTRIALPFSCLRST